MALGQLSEERKEELNEKLRQLEDLREWFEKEIGWLPSGARGRFLSAGRSFYEKQGYLLKADPGAMPS